MYFCVICVFLLLNHLVAHMFFLAKHSANRTDMHVSVFLFWNNGLLNYATAQLKCTTLTVQKTQKGHARLF